MNIYMRSCIPVVWGEEYKYEIAYFSGRAFSSRDFVSDLQLKYPARVSNWLTHSKKNRQVNPAQLLNVKNSTLSTGCNREEEEFLLTHGYASCGHEMQLLIWSYQGAGILDNDKYFQSLFCHHSPLKCVRPFNVTRRIGCATCILCSMFVMQPGFGYSELV